MLVRKTLWRAQKVLSWQRFPDEGAPRGKPAASEEHSRVESDHSDRSLARRTDRGATVGERTGGAELDGLVCLPRGGENCRGRREEGTKEAVTRREETEKPRAFRFVSDIHVGLGGGAVVL